MTSPHYRDDQVTAYAGVARLRKPIQVGFDFDQPREAAR